MIGLPSTANLARIARIVALLLFLLPWTSVSCSTHGLDRLADAGAPTARSSDIPIARATGLQLAIGSVSYADTAPFSSAMDEVSRMFEKPNPAVAGAALLILLSFGASSVLGRARGTIAGLLAVAIAAAALCYAVLVELPMKADILFNRLEGSRMGIEIHVEPRIGFWLCLAALIAAAIFDVLAMRGSAPAAEQPPGG